MIKPNCFQWIKPFGIIFIHNTTFLTTDRVPLLINYVWDKKIKITAIFYIPNKESKGLLEKKEKKSKRNNKQKKLNNWEQFRKITWFYIFL